MNYDEKCREDFKINKNSCIAWYLMASYAYYVKDESLLSDSVFDKMCLHILTNWDTLEHKLKSFVPKESLSAGTGYNIAFSSFPNGFVAVIENLIRGLRD